LGALELFDYFLKEWPDDAMLSTVLDGRAECFVRMGELDQAVEAYRKVFECLRSDTAVQTPSPLDFGWLVGTTPLPKLYDEVLSVLDEFPRDTFPIERYRTHAIQALIFDARRKRTKARAHARAALAEAAITHSGMRYHPTFGLVQSADQKVRKKLHTMAT
jgi:hypothetical protein